MEGKALVNKTARHVKEKMIGEGSGHDWWHVYRVWNLAVRIAKEEKGSDITVVQLGALLHDIADWKFSGGDETAGGRVAARWLARIGADKETIEQVNYIVDNVSFKGAGVRDTMKTKEGKIVQDADRLDALGAMGIARTFMYGGYKKRLIYDPERKPEMHKLFSEYKASSSPSINHFYEKLLLLKGRMHTKTAKRIAAERDKYMRGYLKQFFDEWDGRR